MSKRFSLNKEDLKSIGKVAVWTGVSAIVTYLASIVNLVEIPEGSLYVYLVPIVNILLVALKKFATEHIER